MQKKPLKLPINPLRDDTPEEKRRVDNLVQSIYSESPYAVKKYTNSRGQVILNVTDPRSGSNQRVAPFVVRDEAEWIENKPAKAKRKDGDR